MPKLKKMPNTKDQSKYIGPHTVSEVTDSHVIISKAELGAKKNKLIPIHIAKPYYDRSTDIVKKISRKRKASEDELENNSKKVKGASEQLIYGFAKYSIMSHMDNLKEILKKNIANNTFMTPLHEELHKSRNIAHQYTPNSCFLKFLNDATPDDMKIIIRDTLENWVEELYPGYSDALKMKYSDKILYGVAFEYLNTMLWETFPDYQYARSIHKGDPKISVISERWQREKCAMLGFEFNSTIPQPTELIGKELGNFKPLNSLHIKGDGNCLYRCLSTLLTGNQESHSQMRSTIGRFIASEGTTEMCNFFKTKQMTPGEYLTNSLNDIEGEWGTDVEIVAASAMLKTDIYIATEFFPKGELIRHASWHLYSFSDAENTDENAIFISNFYNHFEPVIAMTHSSYSTYGDLSSLGIIID